MGRIKIAGMTEAAPLKTDDPFERILQRQSEIRFVLDSAERRTIPGGEAALHYLVRREARNHPEIAAKMLEIVCSYAIVSYSWATGELIVRFRYRDTLSVGREAFTREYCSFCESVDEIPEILREKAIHRKRYIIAVVPYDSAEYPEERNQWIEMDRLHREGSFNDGIYLERHIKNIKNIRFYIFMGLFAAVYELEYRTTYEQELQLYRAVDQAIEEMGLKAPDVSIHDKIVAVYRYISQHVVYDQTYERYTAYDAMIERCAVCQGYATLFYLFMRKLDIPVEYISGISEKTNGRHGWNIVKHGRYWYNIDTTWEQFKKVRKILISENRYFLKNTEDFTDHIRDAKYMTPEFQAAHPMGKRSI